MRPQKCEFFSCFKNTVVSWSRVIDENFAVKMKTGFRLPFRRTNDTKGMRAITEEDSCPSIAERLRATLNKSIAGMARALISS